MPYRIEKGSRVLLVLQDGDTKSVVFDKTIDFVRKELIASPMDEHRKSGIPYSIYSAYPWGFSVEHKWSKGDDANEVRSLYVNEVRSIRAGISQEVNTVVVQGSNNNQYTVILSDAGDPTSCTCPAHRFRQMTCKHMRQVAQRTL